MIADEVETDPLPDPVEVLYLLPWASYNVEIVPEVERRSSAVNAPLMVEIVDEVERRLLILTLPLMSGTERYPDNVSFVPEALVYLKVAIVVEAERIDEETSPATLISPKTTLVLFLHSIKLAVWVEVED